MKNSRRFFLAGIMSMAALSLTACGFGGHGDRSLEAAFSKDSILVMMVDFSSDTQVKNFNNLIDQFPTTGLMGYIPTAFDSEFKDQSLSWKDDISPILAGKWSVGVGVGVPNEKDSAINNSPKFVISAKFSESTKVSALLNKLLAGKNDFWKNVKYEKKDGVEYWTEDSRKMYWAMDNNILVAAMTEQDRSDALARLDKDDGIDKSDSFSRYSKKEGGGFATYYFNSKALLALANPTKDSDKKLLMVLGVVKDSYTGVFADEDGFRGLSQAAVDEKSEGFKKLFSDPSYKLSFIDKVNSKGLFFYTEGSRLSSGLLALVLGEEAVNSAATKPAVDNSAGSSLQTNVLGALGVTSADVPDAISPIPVEGQSLRGLIGDFVKKIMFLLDSPYAISISDKDNYLPAVAFYFKIQDADLAQAKGLLTDFDGYVDNVILEVNKVIPAIEGQTSALKKDVVAMNGGALHKVYVDWKAVPQEMINDWSNQSGINVTSVKNQFYYGLMGDNTFVIAWYPDFPNEYGKDVLAQNADYKESFGRLGDGYGMSLIYLNTKSLVTFVDKFLMAYTTLKADDPVVRDLSLGYIKLAEKFIGTVKYLIVSSGYKDEIISSEAFVKIEKVKSPDAVAR